MNGCTERECPCRMWVNCHTYNNYKYKQSHNDEHLELIHEYYENNFRIRYEQPDIVVNG